MKFFLILFSNILLINLSLASNLKKSKKSSVKNQPPTLPKNPNTNINVEGSILKLYLIINRMCGL